MWANYNEGKKTQRKLSRLNKNEYEIKDFHFVYINFCASYLVKWSKGKTHQNYTYTFSVRNYN